MQTPESIEKLVFDCEFNDWQFRVGYDGGQHADLPLQESRPWLQVRFSAPCNMNAGEEYTQSGRKWMLSYHMTDDEVVSTALKAVLTANEHEVREQFKWRGQPIYRPHYDIYELHKLSERNAVSKRD